MREKSEGRNETKPTTLCNAQTSLKHAVDERGDCDPNKKQVFGGS